MGEGSLAGGVRTLALGQGSSSFGVLNLANAIGSSAIGLATLSSGIGSAAIGVGAFAGPSVGEYIFVFVWAIRMTVCYVHRVHGAGFTDPRREARLVRRGVPIAR